MMMAYSTDMHRFTRYGATRDQHFDLTTAHLRPSTVDPFAWVYMREDDVCYGSALLVSVEEAQARGMALADWNDQPHLEIRPKGASLADAPLLALYFVGVYGTDEEDIERYLRMQQEREVQA